MPNCLVIIIATTDTDITTARWSGVSNADLVDLIEREDQSTDEGNGGGIGLWTGERLGAGAYRATTATAATATTKGFMTVALRPATRVELNTGTWKVDVGRIDAGVPYALKQAKHLSARTLGLGVPTLAALYKFTSDYDTGALSTLKTFDSNSEAEVGAEFPDAPRSEFRTMNLEFDGVGDSATNAYAILQDALLNIEEAPPEDVARTSRMRRR